MNDGSSSSNLGVDVLETILMDVESTAKRELSRLLASQIDLISAKEPFIFLCC